MATVEMEPDVPDGVLAISMEGNGPVIRLFCVSQFPLLPRC